MALLVCTYYPEAVARVQFAAVGPWTTGLSLYSDCTACAPAFVAFQNAVRVTSLLLLVLLWPEFMDGKKHQHHGTGSLAAACQLKLPFATLASNPHPVLSYPVHWKLMFGFIHPWPFQLWARS